MKVPCALRCLFHCSNGRLSVTPRIKWKKTLVRGNRKATLARVMEPVKDKYSPEMYRKVIAAFSLLYGSEVFLVMKDIWGMDNQQVIDNVQWMAKAIINQANSESSHEDHAG